MDTKFKEKCSFITPFYNTPRELFENYAKHILKHGVKILIVNDGSDEEHTKMLYEIMGGNDLVKIIEHPKNKGLPSALKTALEHVDTEYLIRVDSDDMYKKFPEFDFSEDVDVFLLQKAQDNLDDFLRYGRSWNCSVIKTELYKQVFFNIFDFLNKVEKFVHEDMFTWFEILSLNPKIQYVKNKGICHRQRHAKSMSFNKNIHIRRKRWETFMLWCVFRDNFNLYLEKQLKHLKSDPESLEYLKKEI